MYDGGETMVMSPDEHDGHPWKYGVHRRWPELRLSGLRHQAGMAFWGGTDGGSAAPRVLHTFSSGSCIPLSAQPSVTGSAPGTER